MAEAGGASKRFDRLANLWPFRRPLRRHLGNITFNALKVRCSCGVRRTVQRRDFGFRTLADLWIHMLNITQSVTKFKKIHLSLSGVFQPGHSLRPRQRNAKKRRPAAIGGATS